MDIITGHVSDPLSVVEQVKLVDDLPAQGQTIITDSRGNPTANGNVIVTRDQVIFIWARFTEPVKAGQVATMVVTNIPATTVMDGAASQWDMSINQPTFGSAVIALISAQRGPGVGRIVCRNTYHADLHVAAGITVGNFPDFLFRS